MSKVNVHKIRGENQSHPVLQKAADLVDNVRTRAFELFEKRGSAPGGELADWLHAEAETLRVPDIEIAEHQGEIELQVALPGFHAKNIRVAALRDMVIVVGEATRQTSPANGNRHVSETQERRAFRQIFLPQPVDVDHVSATFDNGVLQVRASKAKREKSKVAVA